MFEKSPNGIITINRGDTATFDYFPNLGSGAFPDYYTLKRYNDKKQDILYFAVLEPGQKWEDAILKKVFTVDNLDLSFTKEPVPIIIHFYSEDTEYLKPGNYYYQIKLQRCDLSTSDHFEHVDTVQQRTKFIVLE